MSTTNENTRNEEHFHPEHALELLQKLQLLLSAGENGGGLCDVVLIAGKNGQRVPGHRVILAASSPYFEALFTGNMRESTATEVTLGDDVHGDYLQPLVQFCYTGKIKICADTVDELMLTASRLQLDAVVNGCSKFMERRLDVSNCLGVAALANLLSLTHLTHVAKIKACKDFVQVSQEEEFLQLDIDELKVLIASDDLNVPSEEAVFHSVMSWVRYDKGKRSKHMPALLALVRLSLLSHTFLTEHVWDLCHKHPECMPLFKESTEEANMPIRSRRSRPRKSMRPSLLAVWRDITQKPLKIAEYSPVKDEWKLLSDNALSKRLFYNTACLKNDLIIVGGLDEFSQISNTVESINLATMTTSELPAMAEKRSGHGVAVLYGLLYAVGGSGRTLIVQDSVERYNPNTSKWSGVAPLLVARRFFGLAALNGRLFAVGGKRGRETFLNSTECYDPKTDKWTRLANLNISRSHFGIASGNGFLYAVGGLGDGHVPLQSIERYDPQADKWTEICSLSSPQDEVSCVFLDDRLFVVGSNEERISLQEYNLVSGTWTECRTFLSNFVRCLRVFFK